MNFRRLVGPFLFVFSATFLIGKFVFHDALKNQLDKNQSQLDKTPNKNTNVLDEKTTERKKNVEQAVHPTASGWTNQNNSLHTNFPKNYAAGTLHSSPAGFNEKVRWVPTTMAIHRNTGETIVLSETQSHYGELKTDSAGNQVVEYSNTHPFTDELFFVRSDGSIEHDIILKKPFEELESGDHLVYSGRLQLQEGMTLWDGDIPITNQYITKNGIEIRNRQGFPAFRLRAPYAFDSSVKNSNGRLDKNVRIDSHQAVSCYYHITVSKEEITISTAVPTKWLLDSKRQYPVIIDPNIGTGGLQDSFYVAEVGSGQIRPLHNSGGNRLPLIFCPTDPDRAVGIIQLPFEFVYYGCRYSPGDILFVHLDGWASFVPAGPPPCYGPPHTPTSPPLVQCEVGTGSIDYPNDDPHLTSQSVLHQSFLPYWDNLTIGPDGQTTSQNPIPAESGIYWTVEGTSPNRQLVIEWYNMSFQSPADQDKVVTFNLILHECDDMFQYILLEQNQVDPGNATVGTEARIDIAAVDGIRYCYNSSDTTPTTPTPPNTPPPPETPGSRITPGTVLTFTGNAAGSLDVETDPDDKDNLSGCIPFKVCFDATIIPPVSNCANLTPPSYTYHWEFTRNGSNSIFERFGPKICHSFNDPGLWSVRVVVTDHRGVQVEETINVNVCDVPRIQITADPQGGYWPLLVNFEAHASTVGTFIEDGPPTWRIDQLGENIEPGTGTPVVSMLGEAVSHRFDFPGIFRTTATFTGTDLGIPSSASGVIFIYVENPTGEVGDGMVITASNINIDWKGKVDNGRVPNQNGQNGGDPDTLPDDPKSDSLNLKGYINMPGVTQSDLAGKRVRVILNGTQAIIEGFLDGGGKIEIGNKIDGRIGLFQVKQPAGTILLSMKKVDLMGPLGITNITEKRLLPAHFRLEIQDYWPEKPTGGGAIITYEYQSTAFRNAKGKFQLGRFTKEGVFRKPKLDLDPSVLGGPTIGKLGGQNLLISGGLIVTQAKINVKGDDATVDLKGFIARAGGDDLKPTVNSDVTITIGNWTETLNFGTTPTFKTTGRAPSTKFFFKRDKSLGKNGILKLKWANRAGTFSIKSGPIPVSQLGLDLDAGIQALPFEFHMTPESQRTLPEPAQQFVGKTRFEISKKSQGKFEKKAR